MKQLLLVLVIVAAVSAAVVRAPSNRANLNIGYVVAGDRLLYRTYVYQPPRTNTIQYQDVAYHGNFTTRITAIRAIEVGASQYASVWVMSGGVGSSNVTVRFQSATGYGYYYSYEVWGR